MFRGRDDYITRLFRLSGGIFCHTGLMRMKDVARLRVSLGSLASLWVSRGDGAWP